MEKSTYNLRSSGNKNINYAELAELISESSNDETVNKCIECGVDMGSMNPRQLCGKNICLEADTPVKQTKQNKVINKSNYNRSNKKQKLIVLDDSSSDSERDVESILTSGTPSENETDKKFIKAKKKKKKKNKKETNIKYFLNQDFYEGNDEDEDYELDPDYIEEEDIREKLGKAMEEMFINKQYDPKTHNIKSKKNKKMLRKIKEINQNKNPNINKILRSNLTIEEKSELMNKYLILMNTPQMSFEYTMLRDHINDRLKSSKLLNQDDEKEYKNEIMRLSRERNDIEITTRKILSSTINDHKKVQLLTILDNVINTLDDDFHTKEAKREALEKIHLELQKGNNPSNEYYQKYKDLVKDVKEFKENDKSFERQIVEFCNHVNNQIIKSRVVENYEKFKLLDTDSEEYHKYKIWFEYALQYPTETRRLPVNENSTPKEIEDYTKYFKTLFDDMLYGMKEFKKIAEMMIYQLIKVPNTKNLVFCLHGPAGVGKTTAAKALAKALNRAFINIHVGGESDPMTLKGGSKGYIGMDVGKLWKSVCESKCKNPVVLIDEPDKMGTHGGSSEPMKGVLTEILDKNQNNNFHDKFIELPMDLSQVIFILCVNDILPLGGIVTDRMQVIKIKGYNLNEKIDIAKEILIPRILKNSGFKNDNIIFTSDSIKKVISMSLIKEEGVRQLERNLENIMRQLIKLELLNKYPFNQSGVQITIDSELISQLFYEPSDKTNLSEMAQNMYL